MPGRLWGTAPPHHLTGKKQPTSILKLVCCPQALGGCLFISSHFNTSRKRLGAGIHHSCGASSEIVLFDLPAKLGGWVETKFSPSFLFSKKPFWPWVRQKELSGFTSIFSVTVTCLQRWGHSLAPLSRGAGCGGTIWLAGWGNPQPPHTT